VVLLLYCNRVPSAARAGMAKRHRARVPQRRQRDFTEVGAERRAVCHARPEWRWSGMSYDGTPRAGCMALARRQRGGAAGAWCTWTEEQMRGERRAEDVGNWYGGVVSSDPDASVRSLRLRSSHARAHRAETDECCWRLYQRSGTIPSNPSARPLNRNVMPVIYSRESGSLVVIPPGPLPVPCCRPPTQRRADAAEPALGNRPSRRLREA
jgi:hypothetical protein